MCRELSEKEILDTVRDIRHEAPGIGAYKLYLMFKELYPDEMRGRDWFYGLMHESHLMLKPGKRRHTTSSNHPYRKYKNMIKGLTVNRINQLWVADITYIDTDEGVAYLHLLTDAFTHEIIGWILSDSLVASNTVTALDMGISHVSPLGFDGLIHHSDRGVQYCCNQYIDYNNIERRGRSGGSVHRTLGVTRARYPCPEPSRYWRRQGCRIGSSL